MIKELRTSVGILEAEIKMTYHVNWFITYDKTKKSLEQIFELAYGKPMEMLESPNDTDYSLNIKKEEICDYDQRILNENIARGHFTCWHLGTMLTDLVNKNIIPQGNYVVNVSW
jgi:hypothetical protein